MFEVRGRRCGVASQGDEKKKRWRQGMSRNVVKSLNSRVKKRKRDEGTNDERNRDKRCDKRKKRKRKKKPER